MSKILNSGSDVAAVKPAENEGITMAQHQMSRQTMIQEYRRVAKENGCKA